MELRFAAKEWDGHLARQREEQKRRATRPSHSFSPPRVEKDELNRAAHASSIRFAAGDPSQTSGR